MSNAKDYHPVPQWLNHQYIENVLRNYRKNPDIKIKDLIVEPATAKGENYASVMTRIKVSFYETSENIQQDSWLVKTTFETDDLASKLCAVFKVCEREMYMYEKVLPKISELLKLLGEGDKLFASTVHVDYENEAIIFEDLSKNNFVMADRIQRLDTDHIHLALGKLAKYHACTAVLSQKYPGIFADNFDKGFCCHYDTGLDKMVIGMLNALSRYVAGQKDLKHKYYDKILNLRHTIMDYGNLAFDVCPSEFMTLTHGDFWTNNIMFKYTGRNGEKSVVDVNFVDFQFSCWTSPTLDLHYFFNTSLKEDLQFEKQPEFMQYYHEILSNTLKALEYEGHIPTLFELRLQFEKRSIFGKFQNRFIIFC